MSSGFFWGTEVEGCLVVRDGTDAEIECDRDGNSQHTRKNIVVEQLLSISLHYPGLPDPRTLSLDEIEFFYEGLRPTLKAMTRRDGD